MATTRLAILFALCVAACGTDSAGNPTLVHVTLMPPTLPSNAFVAYEDGSGEWRATPTPVAGVISLPIHGATYGVAVLCSRSSFNTIEIHDLAVTDPTSWSLFIPCGQPQPTGMLSGTITTITNTDHQVNFGPSSDLVSSMAGTSVSYSFAATPGLGVLFAARNDSTSGVVDRLLVQRNFTVGSATVRDIDFTTEGGVPVVVAAAANSDYLDVGYYLSGSYAGEVFVSSPPYQIYELPVAQRDASDKYDVNDEVTTTLGTTFVDNVVAAPMAPTIPTQPTLVVGAELTASGVTVKIPSSRPPGSVTIVEDAPCLDVASCNVFEFADLSDAYVAQQPTWMAPDFSAIAGWSTAQLDTTQLTSQLELTTSTGTFPDLGFSETSFSYTLTPSAARVLDRRVQRALTAAHARTRGQIAR